MGRVNDNSTSHSASDQRPLGRFNSASMNSNEQTQVQQPVNTYESNQLPQKRLANMFSNRQDRPQQNSSNWSGIRDTNNNPVTQVFQNRTSNNQSDRGQEQPQSIPSFRDQTNNAPVTKTTNADKEWNADAKVSNFGARDETTTQRDGGHWRFNNDSGNQNNNGEGQRGSERGSFRGRSNFSQNHGRFNNRNDHGGSGNDRESTGSDNFNRQDGFKDSSRGNRGGFNRSNGFNRQQNDENENEKGFENGVRSRGARFNGNRGSRG
ncbi:unnamed protein product, partial [Didymodactylos carnosus]